MLSTSHLFQLKVWPTLCLFMPPLARGISSLLSLLSQPAAAALDDVSYFGFALFTKPSAKRKKEVLSLDLLEDNYLYRIKKNTWIVYVSVLDGDIFPLDCRTSRQLSDFFKAAESSKVKRRMEKLHFLKVLEVYQKSSRQKDWTSDDLMLLPCFTIFHV